jgi:amino acid transporter
LEAGWHLADQVLVSGALIRQSADRLVLWGFVYAFIGNIASTLSHSEIFAVFPTAGGQYHWAAMISPPSYRAAVSWTTGLMNVISLWLGAATVGYLAGKSKA